jgi:tRNA-specific 2-thiouridylase
MENKIRKRVAVAMSGGVDSSVAAAILKNEGFEVFGITMSFLGSKTQGIIDAKKVCRVLGIKHFVVDLKKEMEKEVISDLCRQYLSGRTPNPCVRCNQLIKFGALLNKSLSLGADFFATGHYARVIRSQGKFLLKKAKDLKKDQSYFLYRLSQGQLKHLIFPLGNYTKEQVRELAVDFKLPVADKADSQEICFIPGNNYRKFLISRMEKSIKPGVIVDKLGNTVGEHKGVSFYTIGQREGLGIALGYPAYVLNIDPRLNKITVGRKPDVYAREFLVKNARTVNPLKKKVAVSVRIRYNHKEALADIAPYKNSKIRVCFRKPQFAVTAGQSAVFYKGDTVLGGGIIELIR